jgi:hypothetical protein
MFRFCLFKRGSWEEHHFERKGNAGASKTCSMQANAIRKGVQEPALQGSYLDRD